MNKAIESPVFLVGPQRSGTTMLSLMLKHHPELAWAGEMEYLTKFISEGVESIQLNDYYELLETDRGFLSSGLSIDRNLEYPNLMHSFMDQLVVRYGKPNIGATVHGNFHLLPHIWPKARFIYLLRDGRDVTRSCIQMGWAGNFWIGSKRWLTSERQFETLQQSIDPQASMEVRYEELLSDPAGILSDICSFIGIEYSSEMMQYDKHTTYSKPDPSLAYQWKRKLTDKELQQCEARISEQLEKRGYPLSGLPLVNVSYVEDFWLKIQSKLARIRFRIKRYGWKLYLTNKFARLFRLKSLEKSVRLKIHEITVGYLK